jgi:hypothetical protein
MGTSKVTCRRYLVCWAIGGFNLLSGCVTTSTVPKWRGSALMGERLPTTLRYCNKANPILLLAMPILIAERQPQQHADAWPRRDISSCAGIRQRTCVQHTLPPPNAGRPTGNDHSWHKADVFCRTVNCLGDRSSLIPIGFCMAVHCAVTVRTKRTPAGASLAPR